MPLPSRQDLRQQLLQKRETWAAGPQAAAAQDALHAHLMAVLAELEPACLGLYWPIRGEFNPRPLALEAQASLNCTLALPWATRKGSAGAGTMAFRRWDGTEPSTVDECGIPSPEAAPAAPDVVLVPCVGYTRQGFRLGYGGGYFDRYLAAHPHVTTIGVTWDEAEMGDDAFQPQAHDQPLTLVVTPRGVASE